MTEQADRLEAVKAAATFYSGRDGIGPAKLFETAELIRWYIAHGKDDVLRRRAATRR